MKHEPSIKDLILLKKIDIINTREQIQEDIMTYAAISTVPTKEVDALCQIVIDNFNKHLVVSGQGYFNEIYMAELDGRRETEEKGFNKD
tara:strand:+ start:185 stop:451 length:267 start_codon:yes stop_codon:yes gene_type:complete